MKNKRFILLFIVCLLLSACGVGSGNQPEDPPMHSSTEPTQAEATVLTAEFPALDNGLEALKPLIWGSHGWQMYSGGEYLFAAFGRHLVRYNIIENKIDSVVEFGAPEHWLCRMSVSPDGEAVVAKAWNHPEHNAWTNQILVDFKEKNCESVSDEFKLPESKIDSYSLYEVETAYGEDAKAFYKLTALNTSIKDREIRSVPHFAVSIGAYTIIDANRMGVIIGSSEESNGYLGYDTFAVIDIEQDKFIQECIINEWGL